MINYDMPTGIAVITTCFTLFLIFYLVWSLTKATMTSYICTIPFAVISVSILGYPVWVCFISIYTFIIGGSLVWIIERWRNDSQT